MVHLYTRVNNFCDVIMKEEKSRFQVELRHRDNILDQFKASHVTFFLKSDENAEDKATKVYENIVEVSVDVETSE